MGSERRGQRVTWQRWLLVWVLLPVLAGTAHAQSERKTGDWQQYVFVNDVWHALGVYRVEQNGSEYRMAPVSQTEGPGIITSKGLTNVLFAGENWTFNSDWGNGDVAAFR